MKCKTHVFWAWGQRTLFAVHAGISRKKLSDIMCGRETISVKRAFMLEAASATFFKKPIPWTDWVLGPKSKHPAFSLLLKE